MSTTPPTPPPPPVPSDGQVTGDAAFDAYTASMEASGAALLGHLVLYSFFDFHVAPDQLRTWFDELGLDTRFLPPPLRQVDAFESATGKTGATVRYPLDNPTATDPTSRRGTRRSATALPTFITLMQRPVRRDGGRIVRNVVREVRDERASKLAYNTKIAEVVFLRDHSLGAPEGAGTLQITPNNHEIAKLAEAERTVIHQMLDNIAADFRRRCTYLPSDRMRSLVRSYIEDLGGIKVRSTGGVYFVHRRHVTVLAGLRALVERFDGGSHLVRIPIPDQDEMRQMVVTAFTTKAKVELDALARDIVDARHNGDTAQLVALHARFTALKETTGEHEQLLQASLDDTRASLSLVNLQLGALLTALPDESEDA